MSTRYPFMKTKFLATLVVFTYSFCALAVTPEQIKENYKHLSYLDKVLDPSSDVIHGDVSALHYKEQYELKGPVKTVTMFEDEERTKLGYFTPISTLPWVQDYLEFDMNGLLVKAGSSLGSDTLKEMLVFEYKDGRLVRRYDYLPPSKLERYKDYAYDSNGFISKVKRFSSEDKLERISKYTYRNKGKGCYSYVESYYDAASERSDDYFEQTTCKYVQFGTQPGEHPYLRRGDNKMFYVGNELDYIFVEERVGFHYVFFQDNGDVSFIRRYSDSESQKKKNYSETIYRDIQVDKFGNWLDRKIFTLKFVFNELVKKEEKSLHRTITYHSN